MRREMKEGEKYRVLFNVNPDAELFSNYYLPVEVWKDYPQFIICKVIPHHNPVRNLGISKPYTMTINKIGIGRDTIIKDWYPLSEKER